MMKFGRAFIFGVAAVFAMLLSSFWPSIGWIFMLVSLPLWLLFIAFLVRALRP
jgi:hypothetical protein